MKKNQKREINPSQNTQSSNDSLNPSEMITLNNSIEEFATEKDKAQKILEEVNEKLSSPVELSHNDNKNLLKSLIVVEKMLEKTGGIFTEQKLKILKKITNLLTPKIKTNDFSEIAINIKETELYLKYLQKQDDLLESILTKEYYDPKFHFEVIKDIADVHYLFSEMSIDSELNMKKNISAYQRALFVADRILEKNEQFKAGIYEEMSNSYIILNQFNDARKSALSAFELYDNDNFEKKAKCKLLVIEADEKQGKSSDFESNACEVIDLIKKVQDNESCCELISNLHEAIQSVNESSKTSKQLKKEILFKLKLLQESLLPNKSVLTDTTKEIIARDPISHINLKNDSEPSIRRDDLFEKNSPNLNNIDLTQNRAKGDNWWKKLNDNKQQQVAKG